MGCVGSKPQDAYVVEDDLGKKQSPQGALAGGLTGLPAFASRFACGEAMQPAAVMAAPERQLSASSGRWLRPTPFVQHNHRDEPKQQQAAQSSVEQRSIDMRCRSMRTSAPHARPRATSAEFPKRLNLSCVQARSPPRQGAKGPPLGSLCRWEQRLRPSATRR